MKLFSFTPFSRRKASLTLPLFLLSGALVQVAQAQSSGATQPPTAAGFFSQLFSGVGAISMLALIMGYFRPQMFAFLFKEKTTKGRVCGTFGAAMIVCAILGSSLEPKPVVTAQERSARSAQAKAQSEAKAAEQRAAQAEARAAKAEKAAAVASAKAKAASKDGQRVAGAGSKETRSSEAPKNATAQETLPDNVEVMDIPGVGKRQVGLVDEVAYTILGAETSKALGSEFFNRQADGVFYVLRVAARNTDKETHVANTMLMKMLDDQEREFSPSSEAGMALAGTGDQSAQPFSAQLQPGVTKNFTLVYDAPEDAKGLRLHIPAGFGFGKSASIAVPTIDE